MTRTDKNIFLRIPAIIFFVAIFFPVPMPAEEVAAKYFIDLSAAESYSLIGENAGNEDFLILDVRTPEEYNAGYIDNALNIDFYSDDFSGKLEKLDKSAVYLVYCRSGNRSSRTMRLMKQMGFKSVYNVEGGIRSWVSNGFPMVR